MVLLKDREKKKIITNVQSMPDKPRFLFLFQQLQDGLSSGRGNWLLFLSCYFLSQGWESTNTYSKPNSGFVEQKTTIVGYKDLGVGSGDVSIPNLDVFFLWRGEEMPRVNLA